MVRATPTLLSLGDEQLGILAESVKDQPSSSLVVVAEGIPLVPLKSLDKMHK